MNNTTVQLVTPSFAKFFTEKKFYFKKMVEGKEKTFPMRLSKKQIVVTTAYGETVSFSISNRSKSFTDSRQKKKIESHELKSELTRLLVDKTVANQAIAYMVDAVEELAA